MDMLTIEILVAHCLGGVGHDVFEGNVLVAPHDLSLEAAQLKVRRGWARVIPNAIETKDPTPEAGDPPIETRDPEPETGDPPIETKDPAPENRDPVVTAPAGTPAHKGRPRAGGR